MKIISVSVASFGKIKNLNLKLSDGINIFQNVNGFGKTTLASFVKAMLYGLNYSYTKRKDERINDVSRFAPWEGGGKFGGSMIVEHNGETFRIERFFGATAKSETLAVYNERTGTSVDVGASVGEYFLGLTADSYDRSAYLPQEAVEIAPNENLDARLANLVQNGAEDYDKIQKKLLDYRRERKAGRGSGGKIDVLENEISTLKRQLYDAEQADVKQEQNNNRRRQIADEIASLQQQRRKNKQTLDYLKQQRIRMEPTENQIQARKRFDEACKTLNSYSKDFPSDFAHADEIARSLNKTAVPQSNKLRYVLLVVAALFVLAGIGVAFANPYVGVSIGVAGLCVSVAAFCVKPSRYLPSENDEDLLKEYFRIAAKYVFCEGKDVPTVQRQLAELNNTYTSELNIYNALGQSLAMSVAGADTGQIDAQIAQAEKTAGDTEAKIEALLTEQGRLEAERQPLCSKASIEEKILAFEQQLRIEQENLLVAEVVSQLLEKAKENLSGSYLPKLRDRTAQLLAYVTNGDYQVAVDNNFSVKLRQNGPTKSLAAFSRGIREITVLCFRIALSELLFDGNIPFLLIDDAFVNFDEQNFARATELLRKLSNSTQIIYFTCHNRLGNLVVAR